MIFLAIAYIGDRTEERIMKVGWRNVVRVLFLRMKDGANEQMIESATELCDTNLPM